MTIAGERTSPDVLFSEEIRSASWGSHEQAEHSPFMAALVQGTLEPGRYADLAVQHYFVYEVLEGAATALTGDPVAGPFIRPELTRLPALEKDLVHLLGSDWRTTITATEGTVAYCDRMREVCFDWPGGFVAHHYVRYMGDLSGGQAIRRMVQRHYGLDADTGAAFYSFPGIADLGDFKTEYRGLLDHADWDEAERARIIKEVLLAYELNTRLLEAL